MFNKKIKANHTRESYAKNKNFINKFNKGVEETVATTVAKN